jgi:uncharacterized membrane protein
VILFVHGAGQADLRPLLPVFLSYILSLIYVGIYWNNHHHMLHACTVVTAAPTVLYGVVLLMAAVAYYLLQQTIIRAQGQNTIPQESSRPRSPSQNCARLFILRPGAGRCEPAGAW